LLRFASIQFYFIFQFIFIYLKQYCKLNVDNNIKKLLFNNLINNIFIMTTFTIVSSVDGWLRLVLLKHIFFFMILSF
jgi:hypothetical protein